MDKELRALFRQCVKAGCIIEKRGKHYMVWTPSGEPVTVGATISDWRGLKNARSMLKRKGVKL